MIKHVGLHSAKKVVIVLHKLPSEDHMASIMYSEKLPPAYHDAVMKCLESQKAQSMPDFAPALEGETLEDGRNLARVLWAEGHLKKVPTNQIFVTIDSRNKIRLDELNDHLSKIAAGGEAAAKLKANDDAKGMKNKKLKGSELASVAQPTVLENLPVPAVPSTPQDLIQSLHKHSAQLSAAADALLAEASQLNSKASKLSGLLPATHKKSSKTK